MDVLPFVQVDRLPLSLLSLQRYPVKDKVVTSQLPAVVTKMAVIIIEAGDGRNPQQRQWGLDDYVESICKARVVLVNSSSALL